jgi:argininosuccinate synthase
MKYPKAASYEAKKGEVKKALLLFSGGLDSSVVLRWIQDEYRCKVATLTLDIGQFTDPRDMEKVRQKALKLGAFDAIVYDAKKEFTENYVALGIMANGSYRGKYYLSTPLGRPLIAKIAAEVAAKLGCEAVAHGCTGKGNDQVRLDIGVVACNPSLKIIAPVREWNMSRNREISYAKEHGIPVPVTHDSPYSHDDNLWGNTSEGAEIEDAGQTPCFEKALCWCVMPEKAPDKAETLTVGFEEGLPVSIDGKKMDMTSLILDLNKIGGKHAVGIATVIEDRIVGMKSRGVYESPAAEIIISAHADLEKLVLTHDQIQFKAIVDRQWSWMCYHARWYDPLMTDLNAFLKSINRKLTGEVKVKLFKGTCTPLEVTSPNSLMDSTFSSFDVEDTGGFNVNASASFIEHYGAWQRIAAAAGNGK